jgi:hypothetical protein
MDSKRYFIGRDPSRNQIVIDDPTVTSRHAVLQTEDGRTFDLMNISSTGKVFILEDGQKKEIKHKAVVREDWVSIGAYETDVAELINQADNAFHVFISYSRRDVDRARTIGDFLTNYGLRVWRDNLLEIAKPFDDQLQDRINSTRCVLVLWSTESVKSDWVKAEANLAFKRHVLVPVFIEEGVEPPLLFQQIHGQFVTKWDTEEEIRELGDLARKIDSFLQIAR